MIAEEFFINSVDRIHRNTTIVTIFSDHQPLKISLCCTKSLCFKQAGLFILKIPILFKLLCSGPEKIFERCNMNAYYCCSVLQTPFGFVLLAIHSFSDRYIGGRHHPSTCKVCSLLPTCAQCQFESVSASYLSSCIVVCFCWDLKNICRALYERPAPVLVPSRDTYGRFEALWPFTAFFGCGLT